MPWRLPRMGAKQSRTDVLAKTPLLHKEMIVESFGETAYSKSEAELDKLILLHMTSNDLKLEMTRRVVNLAFDLVDQNGDGTLSRIEVLTGMRRKPILRELLSMRFASPAAFNTIFSKIDVDGSGTIDRHEWETYFMDRLLGRSCTQMYMIFLPSHMLLRWWRPFRSRGYIFLKHSTFIQVWDWVVALGAFYSTVYLPLAIVFVQARWKGHTVVDALIDALLIIDVAIRFRTSCARGTTEAHAHTRACCPRTHIAHGAHAWTSEACARCKRSARSTGKASGRSGRAPRPLRLRRR